MQRSQTQAPGATDRAAVRTIIQTGLDALEGQRIDGRQHHQVAICDLAA